MGRIIGIDLGTTNSCVSVLDSGEVVVLPNSEGARTTPSVVAVAESGERLVGQQAKRQAVVNPERTLTGTKRMIGRKFRSEYVQALVSTLPYHVEESTNGDAWIRVGAVSVSPQEVAAQILRKMKGAAEDYYGEEVTEAVVTVPAYFDDAQRQATRDAGRIAGLEVRRILNEPTAAALAYGFNKRDLGTLVVVDLGGGTFDVSVLEVKGGVFEVLATCGDNGLGGEDFDLCIVQRLAEYFLLETGIDIYEDRMALQRLREAAEAAKCELSTLAETNINLPFLAVDDAGPRHLSYQLSRSELNDLCSDLIDRLDAPCRQALADAGVRIDKLDDVLLVGGMTRMPLVRERVESIFGRKANRAINPDEAVSMGAAIQSSIIEGDVQEVVLYDVTPHSLGIRVRGNRKSTIIPRNTNIPAQFRKVFTTTEDNQTFVSIAVLQGDADLASENRLLGTFNLSGLVPQPAGVPRVEVLFEIDADGITHVSARDVASGNATQVVITDRSGLSDEELHRASERMASGIA